MRFNELLEKFCREKLAELIKDRDAAGPDKTPLLETDEIKAGVARVLSAQRDDQGKPQHFSKALVEREIRRQLLQMSLAKFHRRKYEQLVKWVRGRFSNFSVAEVEEAVQDAFESIFKLYLDREPAPATYEDLQRLMYTAVKNKIFDRMRERSRRGEVPFDDDWMRAGKVLPLVEIEVAPEKAIAMSSLFRKVLEELPPKWCAVVIAMASELTPQEIAKAFGQNGYVLQRWARHKVCAILGKLAIEGDELARFIHARGCA